MNSLLPRCGSSLWEPMKFGTWDVMVSQWFLACGLIHIHVCWTHGRARVHGRWSTGYRPQARAHACHLPLCHQFERAAIIDGLSLYEFEFQFLYVVNASILRQFSPWCFLCNVTGPLPPVIMCIHVVHQLILPSVAT